MNCNSIKYDEVLEREGENKIQGRSDLAGMDIWFEDLGSRDVPLKLTSMEQRFEMDRHLSSVWAIYSRIQIPIP